jgi:LemA protein
MVSLDEGVKSQWAQVENVYQRRADLIPNLVNTVKGVAKFEQETLTQVIEARAKASSVQVDAANLTPEAIQQFQAAQEYNAKIRSFPNNLTASMFGFKAKGYFQAEAGSNQAPKVEF